MVAHGVHPALQQQGLANVVGADFAAHHATFHASSQPSALSYRRPSTVDRLPTATGDQRWLGLPVKRVVWNPAPPSSTSPGAPTWDGPGCRAASTHWPTAGSRRSTAPHGRVGGPAPRERSGALRHPELAEHRLGLVDDLVHQLAGGHQAGDGADALACGEELAVRVHAGGALVAAQVVGDPEPLNIARKINTPRTTGFGRSAR